jgi:Tol biopolymer transport system component
MGPWDAPQRLAAVDTNRDEFSPALSSDKLTLLFASNRNGSRDLFQATRASTKDAFGSVTALAALNTPGEERDPTLSSDGMTLYFTRERRLYKATRSSPAGAFGSPQQVSELANTGVLGASLSADGSELFFSDYLEMSVLRATYSPSTGFILDGTVAALDNGFSSTSPSLSGDGLSLYFQYEPDVLSTPGVYVAHRSDRTKAFGPPQPLAELDLADGVEGEPEISKDGTTIVFVANRGPGGFDLYMADRSCR